MIPTYTKKTYWCLLVSWIFWTVRSRPRQAEAAVGEKNSAGTAAEEDCSAAEAFRSRPLRSAAAALSADLRCSCGFSRKLLRSRKKNLFPDFRRRARHRGRRERPQRRRKNPVFIKLGHRYANGDMSNEPGQCQALNSGNQDMRDGETVCFKGYSFSFKQFQGNWITLSVIRYQHSPIKNLAAPKKSQ